MFQSLSPRIGWTLLASNKEPAGPFHRSICRLDAHRSLDESAYKRIQAKRHLEGCIARLSALDANHNVSFDRLRFRCLFSACALKGKSRCIASDLCTFPITFYSVSFCVMYSVLHVDKFDSTRRCLNGHATSPLAKFCDECGAPAAPDPVNSATISR